MGFNSDANCSGWTINSEENSVNDLLEEERGAFSDTEILNSIKTEDLVRQIKGPSSNALEKNCIKEQIDSLKNDYLMVKNDPLNIKLNQWIDIIGNGALCRKVLQQGCGKLPKVGDWVLIQSKNLSNADKSLNQKYFVLGFYFVVEALDIVIQLMQKGEKCQIKCDSRFARDTQCSNEINSKQEEFEIELIDIGDNFSSYLENSSLNDLSVIDFINEIKDRGNTLYRSNEFNKSIFLYKKGIELLTKNKVDRVVLRQLKTNQLKILTGQFYSNASLCYLKLEEWDEVINFTKKALRYDQSFVKAWYNQAEALCHKKRFFESLKCLKALLKIEPDNEFVKNRILLIQNKLKNQKLEEKLVYQKMLNGVSIDENSDLNSMPKTFHQYSKRRWLILTIIVAILAFIIHIFLRWLILGKYFLQ